MRYHKTATAIMGDIMAYKRQRNQTISIARWNENVDNLYIEPNRTKLTWQAKLNPELNCTMICVAAFRSIQLKN